MVIATQKNEKLHSKASPHDRSTTGLRRVDCKSAASALA
jgi:hypothetical protein